MEFSARKNIVWRSSSRHNFKLRSAEGPLSFTRTRTEDVDAAYYIRVNRSILLLDTSRSAGVSTGEDVVNAGLFPLRTPTRTILISTLLGACTRPHQMIRKPAFRETAHFKAFIQLAGPVQEVDLSFFPETPYVDRTGP